MTGKEQSLADDKMRAEIAKLIAESLKLSTETRWHGFIATIAPMALFFGSLSALFGVLVVKFGA